jgi:murein DD-endopeptidase MepM/ murein hydrolase activator NlpD
VKKRIKRSDIEKLRKKFQLSIFNESTLESVFSLRVSRLDGLFLALSIVIVLFFFSFFLIRYTPIGSFMPQYMETSIRNQLVENAYEIDSLSDVISKQTAYVSVVKSLMSGEISMDSLYENGHHIPLDTLANKHLELMKSTSDEESFRKAYEEKEQYNLSTINTQIEPAAQLFYLPVKGVIVQQFNAYNRQYGVDVRIKERQAVLSVLSGTVIYTGYNPDFRYVIQIQHDNDYVSVYKYNTELLKKQGDVVRAGEAVAIAGSVEGSNEQPHMYFELWQKGIAQNPADLILF